MFSTYQTILAALYKDRLDAELTWREEEDTDRTEELNALWEFDYDEMESQSMTTASIGARRSLASLFKTGTTST